MNFDFPKLLWFSGPSSKDLAMGTSISSTSILVEQPTQQKGGFDLKLWALSVVSLFPWATKAEDKTRKPTTINRGLKRHAQSRGVPEFSTTTRLRFKPYVSKVPWHTGPRAFLSQLFPRYGHYCGPNWSSGKDGGSLLWDRRPIDWLDYCCYCHDMGYDSHSQAELLKADLEFLECLESQKHMTTRGDVHVAHIYKTMCITGLKNILIPYRTHLVKIQFGRALLDFGWLSNVKLRYWNFQKKAD